MGELPKRKRGVALDDCAAPPSPIDISGHCVTPNFKQPSENICCLLGRSYNTDDPTRQQHYFVLWTSNNVTEVTAQVLIKHGLRPNDIHIVSAKMPRWQWDDVAPLIIATQKARGWFNGLPSNRQEQYKSWTNAIITPSKVSFVSPPAPPPRIEIVPAETADRRSEVYAVVGKIPGNHSNIFACVVWENCKQMSVVSLAEINTHDSKANFNVFELEMLLDRLTLHTTAAEVVEMWTRLPESVRLKRHQETQGCRKVEVRIPRSHEPQGSRGVCASSSAFSNEDVEEENDDVFCITGPKTSQVKVNQNLVHAVVGRQAAPSGGGSEQDPRVAIVWRDEGAGYISFEKLSNINNWDSENMPLDLDQVRALAQSRAEFQTPKEVRAMWEHLPEARKQKYFQDTQACRAPQRSFSRDAVITRSLDLDFRECSEDHDPINPNAAQPRLAAPHSPVATKMARSPAASRHVPIADPGLPAPTSARAAQSAPDVRAEAIHAILGKCIYEDHPLSAVVVLVLWDHKQITPVRLADLKNISGTTWNSPKIEQQLLPLLPTFTTTTRALPEFTRIAPDLPPALPWGWWCSISEEDREDAHRKTQSFRRTPGQTPRKSPSSVARWVAATLPTLGERSVNKPGTVWALPQTPAAKVKATQLQTSGSGGQVAAFAIAAADELYAIAGKCIMMDEPTYAIRVFAVWGNRDIKVDFISQVVKRDPRFSKPRLEKLAEHADMPVFNARTTDEDCERQARLHWQHLSAAEQELWHFKTQACVTGGAAASDSASIASSRRKSEGCSAVDMDVEDAGQKKADTASIASSRRKSEGCSAVDMDVEDAGQKKAPETSHDFAASNQLYAVVGRCMVQDKAAHADTIRAFVVWNDRCCGIELTSSVAKRDPRFTKAKLDRLLQDMRVFKVPTDAEDQEARDWWHSLPRQQQMERHSKTFACLREVPNRAPSEARSTASACPRHCDADAIDVDDAVSLASSTRTEVQRAKRVHALIGRAAAESTDAPLQVFVLWSDKRVTLISIDELNVLDSAQDFQLDRVQQFALGLVEHHSSAAKGAQTWWSLQTWERKQELHRETQRCRNNGAQLVAVDADAPLTKNHVCAILGRAARTDRPEAKLRVFVLWGDQSLTPELAEDLNRHDPEANFSLELVARLARHLPSFDVWEGQKDQDAEVRAWWESQTARQQQTWKRQTKECRRPDAPDVGLCGRQSSTTSRASWMCQDSDTAGALKGADSVNVSSTNSHVYALLGRAIITDRAFDQRLRVFVLWDDKRQITPELVSDLNDWDHGKNFSIQALNAFALTLPEFKILQDDKEPDKLPRAWWDALSRDQKAVMRQSTQQCRRNEDNRVNADCGLSDFDTRVKQRSGAMKDEAQDRADEVICRRSEYRRQNSEFTGSEASSIAPRRTARRQNSELLGSDVSSIAPRRTVRRQNSELLGSDVSSKTPRRAARRQTSEFVGSDVSNGRPAKKAKTIPDENRVHALLGRAILTDARKDERLRVFVLWGDEKQITPEPVDKLNTWDPERNFDLEKVRQLIKKLPEYEITINGDTVDKEARVWWDLQVYTMKQDIIRQTQLCRGNETDCLNSEVAPTKMDKPIPEENRVHAILGKAIVIDDAEEELVMVLWGDEKQITPEFVADLNEWDPEGNFSEEKVRQLISTLPSFKVKKSAPEKADREARAWWERQVPAKKQEIVDQTEMCRGQGKAMAIDKSQGSDVQYTHRPAPRPQAGTLTPDDHRLLQSPSRVPPHLLPDGRRLYSVIGRTATAPGREPLLWAVFGDGTCESLGIDQILALDARHRGTAHYVPLVKQRLQALAKNDAFPRYRVGASALVCGRSE
uniref:Uncharacterized protein n=1 Tax=Eutreptiella gymnastica TaxID=73025 RepID=A0A7S4CV86_9EUGL